MPSVPEHRVQETAVLLRSAGAKSVPSRELLWSASMRVSGSLWLVLALLVGVGPGRVAADAGELSDRGVSREAHALSSDLMSPYCPGRTLADCPSPDAAALRQEIRTRLAAGETSEQVRAGLERQFGDAVVGVPRTPIGWVLPGIGLLIGVWLLRRAWSKIGPA